MGAIRLTIVTWLKNKICSFPFLRIKISDRTDQAGIKPHHAVCQVDGRSLHQKFTFQTDEIQAWLNEPVKHVINLKVK